jgi:hypothetical protein
MTDTKRKRLGGLWKKDLPTGKRLLEGKFTVADLRSALDEVAGDATDVQITIWGTAEEDKRTASSPDASIYFTEKWQKASSEIGTFQTVKKDDIPF